MLPSYQVRSPSCSQLIQIEPNQCEDCTRSFSLAGNCSACACPQSVLVSGVPRNELSRALFPCARVCGCGCPSPACFIFILPDCPPLASRLSPPVYVVVDLLLRNLDAKSGLPDGRRRGARGNARLDAKRSEGPNIAPAAYR